MQSKNDKFRNGIQKYERMCLAMAFLHTFFAKEKSMLP
jgi:hypothetical protein